MDTNVKNMMDSINESNIQIAQTLERIKNNRKAIDKDLEEINNILNGLSDEKDPVDMVIERIVSTSNVEIEKFITDSKIRHANFIKEMEDETDVLLKSLGIA